MTLASIWITGSRGGPIFGVTVLITVLGCHIAIAGGIKGEHRMARSAAESPSLLAYRTVPTQLRAAALHEAVGRAHVYIYRWSVGLTCVLFNVICARGLEHVLRVGRRVNVESAA